MPPPAGYSGTPLVKKLGLKASSQVVLVGAPTGYTELLEPLPEGVVFATAADATIDIAQVLVTRKEELATHRATFKYPRLSFMGDWWMWWQILTGKIRFWAGPGEQ
jgi:hypothetical protein